MHIYKEIIIAKNGSAIPVFKSGKSFHSKYDPQKEATMLSGNTSKNDFFIVTGLGGGYHIRELIRKFPESYFLVVENSEEDLYFLLKNIPAIKDLLLLTNLKVCTVNKLHSELVNTYVPAIYSTLALFPVNSWLQEVNKDEILDSINRAISDISADFSVQAHFGKLWQTNIMNNLKHAKKQTIPQFPLEKQCLITAAGPSLDKKIPEIKENRDYIFLLATDTSFNTLVASKITPDAVISIDGQSVSYSHFLQKLPEETLYIFDLMGNSSAAKKAFNSNKKLLFTISSHPLEKLISKLCPGCFPEVDTSSGTVTIAALDFALKSGFSKIQIAGADFGYLDNKAYAKGTYLDSNFYGRQNKIDSGEKSFSKILYRTELKKISESKTTTEILEKYEKELYRWCENKACSVRKENDVFFIESPVSKKIITKTENFDYDSFIKELRKIEKTEEIKAALLPYISWNKNKDSEKGILKSFDEYSKLALNFILRYTFKYEEK